MLRAPTFLLVITVLAGVACGTGNSAAWQTLETRAVTLPDGFEERAEVKMLPADMAKGMMYRDSLPNGQGMLFVHQQAGMSPYWMGHCKIPLDIVWMDSDHKVVEISAATPPCPSGGGECPSYGGHVQSHYVLEIGSGEAARHRVRNGSAIRF